MYTIADVPYWGLSTCLTNDTVVRGNILTVARMFCTVGAGIVTIFIPEITKRVTEQFKYADTATDKALILKDKAEAIAFIKDHNKTKSKIDSQYPKLPIWVEKFKFTEKEFENIKGLIKLLSARFVKLSTLRVSTLTNKLLLKVSSSFLANFNI